MIDLLKAVMAVPSITGDRARCHECMELFVKAATGLEHVRAIGNDVVIIGRGDLMNPEIGILCHIDVVPPHLPTRQEGDLLFGRGAIDMKGPTVAAFKAMMQSTHPSVAIALTIDEETGGAQAAELARIWKPKRVLIVPDQGRDFALVESTDGVLQARCSTTTAGGHSGRYAPEKNAIMRLIGIHARIADAMAGARVNIARIETSNTAMNVVPSEATMLIDIRSRFTPSEAEKIVRACMDEHDRLEVTAQGEPFTAEDTHDLRSFEKCVSDALGRIIVRTHENTSCDARHFAGKVPTIIVTKPRGGPSHAPDEWVSIASLEAFKAALCQYMDEMNRHSI